jgi:hypothetical protein
MLPFGVTIPATVPQGSEIPEGLMNNPVLCVPPRERVYMCLPALMATRGVYRAQFPLQLKKMVDYFVVSTLP